MADPGSINLIAKLAQKNDAEFGLVDASDVDFGEGSEITLDTNGDFTQPQDSFWFPLDTFGDVGSDNIRIIVRDAKGPKLIAFHPASDARTIVVEHDAGGGNVSCAGGSNITLDDIEDWCFCIYDDTASRWYAFGAGAGGGANHDILDGSVHQDSVADGVTKGSIIIGNATPKWDELIVGADGLVLTAQADGTVAWEAAAGGGTHPVDLSSDVTDTLPLGNGGTGATSIKQSFILYARDGHPSTTAGCDGPVQVEFGTNDVDMWFLDFDTGTDEYAWWVWDSPKNWDAGDVTFSYKGTTTSSDTSAVVMGLAGVAFGSGDVLDAAFSAALNKSSGLVGVNKLFQSPESTALTIAGSPSAGDLVIFRLLRDVSVDTHDSDMRLISVRIEYGITGSLSDT